VASSGWQRSKEVFQAALTCAPELRGAFLDEACGGDGELRREVHRLLAAHDAAGGFLSTSIGLDSDGAEEAGALEAVPQRIGPYRILDTIAHGGMGTVYRAVRDDDAFRKTVALKLVRGGRQSDYFQRRFRQERQILARFQHPNVATVLDGGTTEDGQPYLVMEYVDGQPITDFCAARGMGTRERLVLFRTVCGAVQYAHQNLVVHRDIKPANVLVDGHGAAKLLDFGIAKLLASGVEPELAPTATVLPMLTPEYASPEQVKGQPVTTASDVYSLGVLLYELLAGRRPYEVQADSLEAIVQAVCQTEPTAPSEAVTERSGTRPAGTLPSASELRGDLDTIVLKALRKEPERRYRTAHELSEDLRRHLEGLPVTARADTIGYRAGKFVRRHRTAVAAAFLVSASLVVGIVTTTRQARLAQRRFDEARRLIHTVIFDIQPKMGAVAGTTPLRKELIESTLQYLEALARDAGDNPALLRELSASYVQLARVQGLAGDANVGDVQAARRTLGEAQKLVERLLKLDPDGPESLHEAVSVERFVALSFLYEAAYAPAQQHARRAIERAERLVEVRPDFQAREDLADAHRTFANCSDSAEAFGRSREIYESLLLEKPDEPRILRSLSQVHKYAAGLHYQKGEDRSGLDLIVKARAIDEKLLAANPENPVAQMDLSFSLNQLSWGYSKLGDLAGALAAIQQSLAMQERILARNPGEARIQERLGYARRAMALLRWKAGDPRAARRDYLMARAIYTELRARGYGGSYVGTELGLTELQLGDLAAEERRRAEACQWYRRSAALFGELVAQGALRSDSHEEADKARRAAAACDP
jgi:tetratricopeptide (TPR) repeat protein/tRNA A-37 threonylcarbamoyl transferase component Bud32